MKNNHEITLKQYAAHCEEQPLDLGTAGSYGMEMLSIVREGVWAEYDILATFHPPVGDAVQVRVGVENCIDVPTEATAEKGMGEIVFAGYKEGVRQIAVDVLYKVAPSSGANGTEPAEPTPDVVQQILSAANAAEKLAQSVRDDADAGKFTGAKGDKGDTGPRGDKGDKGDTGEQGPQGVQGETGPAGPQGEQGLKGDKGEVGATGATGPQGPKGDTGPQGERGEQGVQGEKGDPGKDGVQINDDAVNTADTWSSKHIVDTLCPPLEVSGNPAQCYPVAGYPLGVKVSWEPTQEGTGDPSPENVRPIKGRDSVTVERCGENLILYPYTYGRQERNGLVIESQQNGSVIINGTATADTWYALSTNIEKRLPLNTVMSLSGCPAGGNTKTGWYIGLYLGGVWYSEIGAGNTNVVCKTRDIESRIEVSVTKGTVCDNLTFWPKLEIGNKITPYQKYTGQTSALTLPTTIYGGTLDAVTGEGIETWDYIKSYAGEALPGEWISDRDAYNAGATPSTGAQVAYRLAEPVPFTAEGGKAIPTLAGVNTLLTDADTLTVTGRADPLRTIQGFTGRIAALESNAVGG